MYEPCSMTEKNEWAVILAGGDGSRLLSLTHKIFGDDRPKQFCPIINKNTLLEETRRRVEIALPAAKTMFVLTRKHAQYFNDALTGVPARNLVIQPKNAGTTPAILYSLLRLKTIDPSARVAFFPSDHYFADDRAFMSAVQIAFTAARQDRALVTLLGIKPHGPDEEYGWIEPEQRSSVIGNSAIFRVRRFWEKPSKAFAHDLMARGCLWNSFVMVGTVSAFLSMIRNASVELYTKFEAVRSAINAADEVKAIDRVYREIRDSNFSREVLQARPMDLAVLPVHDSKWSDLGTVRRVNSTLSNLRSRSFSGGIGIAAVGESAGGLL